MSTSTILETVRLHSQYLIDGVKNIYHSYIHPDQSIVLIELTKTRADVLTEYCAQLDEKVRPEIEGLLKKARNKLAFAEKVRQFLIEAPNNNAIHPRVEKIIQKLTQMTENPKASDAVFVKLMSWRTKLARFDHDVCNPKTGEALLKAKGISQALLHLAKLSQIKVPPDLESTILDRIYFHLYHIQDKETPNMIDRNDQNWGRTAFQTNGLSTLAQKVRAVERTQVEELLRLLMTVLDSVGEHGESERLVEALEELKLDPSDLPKGQSSAADALYAKYTQIHLQAREKNPSLENPDDQRFGGAFGRHAFYGFKEMDKTVDDLRYAAVKEVLKDFKATWRITG